MPITQILMIKWLNKIENKITTAHDYDKYTTTQETNKLTADNFATRLAQANLASKIVHDLEPKTLGISSGWVDKT